MTADTFRNLKLSQVQPEQCLRSLKASVSRSPTELLPVKPLVELDMVDPRFVATTDVLSGLDSRPNLMDLTPNEFEGLITNLFAEMGLDTRPNPSVPRWRRRLRRFRPASGVRRQGGDPGQTV